MTSSVVPRSRAIANEMEVNLIVSDICFARRSNFNLVLVTMAGCVFLTIPDFRFQFPNIVTACIAFVSNFSSDLADPPRHAS